MNNPRTGIVVVLLLLTLSVSLSAETVRQPNCLIMLIDEAQIAAQESGILLDVYVQEGQPIDKGQPLAKVDDTLAILQLKVAEAERRVAEKEAKNEISVKYAKATARMAAREVERHRIANANMRNAIAQSDVDKAKLALNEAETYIEKALFDLEVKKFEVEVKKASVDAAKEHILRRTITAPWAGVVDRVVRHKGDWVEPGNPILLLVRMDKLRVKCVLDRALYNPSDVDGQPVKVTVDLARGQKATFDGVVTGVSPRVDGDNHFYVLAEVINQRPDPRGHWILRDGMNADMEIELKK